MLSTQQDWFTSRLQFEGAGQNKPEILQAKPKNNPDESSKETEGRKEPGYF